MATEIMCILLSLEYINKQEYMAQFLLAACTWQKGLIILFRNLVLLFTIKSADKTCMLRKIGFNCKLSIQVTQTFSHVEKKKGSTNTVGNSLFFPNEKKKNSNHIVTQCKSLTPSSSSQDA